jgi:2'-5' RNA ligase
VPPANFHITLAFVGEIGNLTLERLCLSVDEWLAGKSVSGADFDLDRVGYWPKPGIYWLGCCSCPQQLAGLAERLKGIAASVGGKRDRKPFQPHVTLYRRCSGAPAAPSTALSIPVSYRHFSLFESIQGKSGVSYHVLQDWGLQTGIS